MSMAVDIDGRQPVVHAPAILKVLGEPVRWRIVELLAREELCVCHLVEELEVAQPLVSHHLRVLREAELVETSRFRYWTYYRLRAGALAELGQAIARLAATAPKSSDRRRPCC
jgi:ArsR family transcriptional regulator, arsenate/arsenite/antimonite-responsive transcriptional repressor